MSLRTRVMQIYREHPWSPVVAIVISGTILRIGIVLARATYTQDYAGTDHGSMAHAVAEGAGYIYKGLPSSFFGPVYTYLWAWAMQIFGHDGGQLALQIAQSVMLGVAPYFVYEFGRLAFRRDVATWAAAWVGFYPEFLLLGSTMFADGMVCALWCACLAIYAWMLRSPSRHLLLAVLFGFCAGCLVLTKGRMLAFVVVLLAALTINLRHVKLRTAIGDWRAVALLAWVLTAAVIAPWTARNLSIHDRLVLVESSAGYNLWIGHNEHATGTGKARLGVSSYQEDFKRSAAFPQSTGLRDALQTATTEIARDDVYMQAAWQRIAADPWRSVELAGRKFVYAWVLDPTNAIARRPAYWLPWMVSLALFVVGFSCRVFVLHRHDLMLWSLIAISTLTQMVFFVIPRLRYPWYPLIFLFAAQGLVCTWTLLRRRSMRRLRQTLEPADESPAGPGVEAEEEP